MFEGYVLKVENICEYKKIVYIQSYMNKNYLFQ